MLRHYSTYIKCSLHQSVQTAFILHFVILYYCNTNTAVNSGKISKPNPEVVDTTEWFLAVVFCYLATASQWPRIKWVVAFDIYLTKGFRLIKHTVKCLNQRFL